MFGYFARLKTIRCTPAGRVQDDLGLGAGVGVGLPPPPPLSSPGIKHGHGRLSQFVFSSARPPLAGGHLANNDMWLPEPPG
jgi:hypothetical protein